MKIAVHQMCSGIDATVNLDKMESAIAEASRGGAIMYFAPEMSVLLDKDRLRAKLQIESESKSAALSRLRQAATAAEIWVHSGSIPVLKDDGTRLANRSFVIAPDGEVRARYDKIHLFDVDLASGESWRESSAYDGGDSPVAVATPIGLLGLTVCYDLRFPQLFAALAHARVDIIAVPAAFTVPTGKAHWHPLLRARAIESEAFVVAAAQSGQHEDGRQTFGHSLVIDPWGDIILDMAEGEELGFADLDLARISEVRKQIPVHANSRRIDSPVQIF